MTDKIVLLKEDFEIVFVSFKWDGIPYKGHAWVKGYYCFFDGGPNFDKNGYTVGQEWKFYILKEDNLVYALAIRRLFEDLVYKDRGSNFFKDKKWHFIRNKDDELENRVKNLEYIGEYKEVFEKDDKEE